MEEKLYKDRNWMHEHYLVQEESTPVMARKAGCSDTTIRRWLRGFGIAVRSSGEGVFLATRNYLTTSQELLDLLEGELLGDGHLALTRGCRSASYRHTSKYREYVGWLSDEFSKLGIQQVGRIRPRQNKEWHNRVYNYQSRSYPKLVPIRQKWYPDGKKIVPKDLRLNPLITRQWYIGDGGLAHPKRGKARPYITLATCDFDKSSIEYLLDELHQLGFKATHQPAKNVIAISTYSTKDFLDWIVPCPEEINDCYGYKWDLSKG